MTGLFRRLRARLRHRDFDDELRQEMEVHRAMAEEALRAAGSDPAEARYAVSRRMGNTLVAREQARGVWIAPWLESIWRDLRYAVRSLVRSPGFTATALLTLTLGVSVNTTLFALLNALLLQPWPAPAAHRLVRVYHRMARPPGEMLVGVSAPELTFLQQAASADVAGTRYMGGRLAFGDNSRPVGGRLVSGNYFDVLQSPIALGRGLQRSDERAGSAAVVVLGHDLWTSFFASDPTVVGRTVRFNDIPLTVVGVAGPGVRESPLEDLPQFWMPLSVMPILQPDEAFAREFLTNAGHCCVDLVGRLRPGSSRAEAQAELSVMDRQFRQNRDREDLGVHVTRTETAFDPKAGKVIPVFALLFAAVALVLLLTCANVGNLQLARAAARRREVTIRLSLGAGRARVVRQLLTEGFVLALGAVALGLIVAPLVARLVMARVQSPLASLLDFSIDGRELLYAAAVTLVTCLVSSLAPALRGTRHLVAGRTADRATLRLRLIFLGAQVAISVVLLIAAALLDRGLTQAASQPLGFRIDTLLALRIERPSTSREAERAMLNSLVPALAHRPVAVTTVPPLADFSLHTGVRRAGEPDEADRPTRFLPVSSNYFAVLGIPLRAGRTFRDGDANEVVLNETLARLLWPGGGALGAHLAGPQGTVGREVVGIAADAHTQSLGAVGPMLFEPAGAPDYLLFHKGEVTPDELRAIVGAIDPSAKTTMQAVGDNVATSLESATVGARVAGGLGLLALAIAAVGIAGVFSFAVTERTREIGIRLALGASPGRVRTLLFLRTARPTAVGVAAGVLLAALSGGALRGFLYGLSPTDPKAYVAVVLGVALMAWAATILPMRRALRVDPAVTLRHD